MSTTLRVSEETRERVASLATRTGRHMQSVVDEAVAAYERDLFWREFIAGYERLADDEEAWRGVQAERRGEEGVLRDDLD